MTQLYPIRNRVLILFTVLTLPAFAAYAQQVKFGNSYVNISKKTSGGTVEPGDTLEIRTNYFFRGSYNGGNIYFVRYVDNIPTNTTYVGDSLRLITNEGLTYKRFTNAADGDLATYQAAPVAGQYNIRIDVGDGAAAPPDNSATNSTGGGNVKPNIHKPKVGGNNLLLTTAFRVRVTGNIGDTITLGAGRLLYKLTNSAAAADESVNAIQYKILIAANDPICSDAIGKNFVDEAGGSFDSGFAHNRSYGPTFLIPSYTYRLLTVTDQIGDGFYTIVNNLSPNRSTHVDSRLQPNCSAAPAIPALDSCKNRMFSGFWDIIGDHTGSTSSTGNPPKDTANAGPGGYMLVVNADYATSEAYRQNITGLCPNTSYEFSLWVRNVCRNCGIDSNNTQTWLPGVLPNLTFAIDDLDRYSSGQVDTVGWIKKGFLFKTGAAQSSITISIRNNASGGGGNDWAIDDIALVTCNPVLDMQPTGNAQICIDNPVDMFTVVSSFFDNYIFWTWDKSTDGGTTWNSTGISGTGSPVLTGGKYEYTASYPTFIGDSAQHLNQYRFKVASSLTNLNDVNCNFVDATTITIMVNDCSTVLASKLVAFNGKLVNGRANLVWNVENENANTLYEVERNSGGAGFKKIGTVTGNSSGQYGFTDNTPVAENTWYRVKLVEPGSTKYSKSILFSDHLALKVQSLINPFDNTISFELITPADGPVMITLIDMYGRTVRQFRESVQRGLNTISTSGLHTLSKGVYTIKIQIGDTVINKQVIKIN